MEKNVWENIESSEHLDRAVRLEVNGVERGFQYTVKAQDRVTISLI